MSGLSAADFDRAARAPLFADLDGRDLALLLDGALALAYPEIGLLFSEGDAANRFFIVLEGRVSLFALTESGDQSIIEVFDPICTFAEAAIFSSGVFPLNCEVAAGTRLIHIPALPFLKRLSENRVLGMKLLAGLAQWQRRLIHEIAELKGKSPAERLASFLLALAGGAAGRVTVRLPLSKAALASRIGVTPESLSRALSRLRAAGVETQGRDIVLTDTDSLRALLRDGGGN